MTELKKVIRENMFSTVKWIVALSVGVIVFIIDNISTMEEKGLISFGILALFYLFLSAMFGVIYIHNANNIYDLRITFKIWEKDLKMFRKEDSEKYVEYRKENCREYSNHRVADILDYLSCKIEGYKFRELRLNWLGHDLYLSQIILFFSGLIVTAFIFVALSLSCVK
ncbi:hypothetical protein ACFL49_00110 [Candidatus Omnitrophota bacterium]